MKKIYLILRPSESEGCHDEEMVEGAFTSKQAAKEFTKRFKESYYEIVPIYLDYWKERDIAGKKPYQLRFEDKELNLIKTLQHYFHAFEDEEVWLNDYPLSLNVFLFATDEHEAQKRASGLIEVWLKNPKNRKYIKNGWLDEKHEWKRLVF